MDLTFKDFLDKFESFGKGEWTIVYSSKREDENESSGFYSALISQDRIAKSLEDPSWDLRIGDGLPGFSFHFEDGKEIGAYLQCSDDGVQPIVIWRGFHGMKAGYWEISEEFRLYFNLYEDKQNNQFVRIDDNGDDDVVVVMTEKEIRIKTKLIKEFLAVKKMSLGLFFDFNRFSSKTLTELKIKQYHEHKKGDDFVFSVGARPWDVFGDETKKSHAFLMGKKIIPEMKDFKPSLFERGNKKYVDFIIDIDDEGKEILNTCNDDELANYFGKNKGKPNYLTPVLFKNEVLTQYYAQPDKYSVEDGYLRCGGLWSLRMDNNCEDYVMVFLGDLGDLSYKEQLYWRSFNLSTKGKMSHVAWSRGFEAEFTDPQKSDLYFKYKFEIFQNDWEREYGWKLFLPLSKYDEHYFKSLHLPLTNEQKEFDEQVLALVKIIIDSLNEKKISEKLTLEKDTKGISKLEQYLSVKGLRNNKMFEFLRNLQSLRSTGTAHRKGKEYEITKNYFKIGTKDLSKIFDEILIKSVWFLNTLDKRILHKEG